MTDTDINTATILGRVMVIRKLTDFQQAHLLRYVNILTSDSVELLDKAEAVDRFLTIVHKAFVDPADLAFITRAEEDGDVSFQDLIGALNDSNGPAKKPAVKRVGRPRKSQ